MKKIIEKLEELSKDHPTFSFGRHISMAFAEYGDIWGLSNKECLFALDKYQAELDMGDDRIATPQYMEKLYKDVENFDDILNEEDGDS